MARFKSSWLSLGVLLAVAGVLCVWMGSQQPPAHLDLNRQWQQAAGRAAVTPAFRERVATLLAESLQRLERPGSAACAVDLRPSLERFLREFSERWSSQETSEPTAWFLVWLMVEAARREPLAPETLAAADRDFQALLERVRQQCLSRAQELLGPEYPAFEGQIDRMLDRVAGESLRWFRRLQADPLFPAFKEPLDKEVAAASVHEIVALTFGSDSWHLPMMEKPGQRWIGRLGAVQKQLPRTVVYVVAWRSLFLPCVQSSLGPMQAAFPMARGTFWPLAVRMTPRDSGGRAVTSE